MQSSSKERCISPCLNNSDNGPSLRSPLHPSLFLSAAELLQPLNEDYRSILSMDTINHFPQLFYSFFPVPTCFLFTVFVQALMSGGPSTEMCRYLYALVLSLWLSSTCTQGVRLSKQVTQLSHRQNRAEVYLSFPRCQENTMVPPPSLPNSSST